MTYNKKTKSELINQDHMEDVIKEEKEREIANEIDDGARDTWIEDNYNDLFLEFVKEKLNENFSEFADYCKDRWNEANEE